MLARDLKLDNILIDQNKNIKIIDFGFSIQSKSSAMLKLFCGTPSYMCPEIINRKPYLGPPADMWSIGVILYTMVNGVLPFKSMIVSRYVNERVIQTNQPLLLQDAVDN
jgi:serine/threonine protein kinase